MRQRYKQNLIEAYLSLHSLRHKENSCGWALNQSNRYQNFLIYLALFIAGDKGRKMSLCQFPTNLLPVTKLGDGAHCRNGDKAIVSNVLSQWFSCFLQCPYRASLESILKIIFQGTLKSSMKIYVVDFVLKFCFRNELHYLTSLPIIYLVGTIIAQVNRQTALVFF